MPVPGVESGNSAGRYGGRDKQWNLTPLGRAFKASGQSPDVSRLDHEAPSTWPDLGLVYTPGQPLPFIRHENVSPPGQISITTVLDTYSAVQQRSYEGAKYLSFQHPEGVSEFSDDSKPPQPNQVLDWLRSTISDSQQFASELALHTGFNNEELKDVLALDGVKQFDVGDCIFVSLEKIQNVVRDPEKFKGRIVSEIIKTRQDTSHNIQSLADIITLTYLRYKNNAGKIRERSALAVALAMTAEQTAACANTPPKLPPITAPRPSATASAKETPTSVVVGELTPVAKTQLDKITKNLDVYFTNVPQLSGLRDKGTTLNFIVNRADPTNTDKPVYQEWVTFVTDGKIVQRPSLNNSKFSLEGETNIFSITYNENLDITGANQLGRPQGVVSFYIYNPNSDMLEYYGQDGKAIGISPRLASSNIAAPTTAPSPTDEVISTTSPQPTDIPKPTDVPMEAATPAPSNTPMEAATPAPSITPAPPAPSATLIKEPTVAPTAIPDLFKPEVNYPKSIWQSDFSKGEEGHASPFNPVVPGHYEYSDYPAGSGSYVFIATVNSETKPGPDGKIRLYPSIDRRSNPLNPDYLVKMKINLSGLTDKDKANLYKWNSGAAISVLDLFDTADKEVDGQSAWHVFAQVRVQNKAGKLYPFLTSLDSKGNGTDGKILDEDAYLHDTGMDDIALEVTSKLMNLYVNGKLASTATGSRVARWIHEGLYTYPWGPNGKNLSNAKLMVDDVNIRVK